MKPVKQKDSIGNIVDMMNSNLVGMGSLVITLFWNT
jgi:hypothetical protein